MSDKITRRLKSLERAIKPPEDSTIRVWHVDPNNPDLLTGPDNQTITRAQFDALPGRHIHIGPEERQL